MLTHLLLHFQGCSLSIIWPWALNWWNRDKIIQVATQPLYMTIFLAELESWNGERLGVARRFTTVVLSSLMSRLMVPQIRCHTAWFYCSKKSVSATKNPRLPPNSDYAWSWQLLIFNEKNACHAFLLTTMLSRDVISTVLVVRCFQFWHSKQCYEIFSMSVTFLQSAHICVFWDQLNESSASW